MKEIAHILVPVCGIAGEDDALKVAFAFAKKGKTKVTAVHVVEVRRSLPLDADLTAETARGERLLEYVEEQAQKAGCALIADLLQARSAGVAIVDESINVNADLIIMALPYRSQFGEFRLGETSNYVLNHAVCRVWLVRDQYDPAKEQPR